MLARNCKYALRTVPYLYLLTLLCKSFGSVLQVTARLSFVPRKQGSEYQRSNVQPQIYPIDPGTGQILPEWGIMHNMSRVVVGCTNWEGWDFGIGGWGA